MMEVLSVILATVAAFALGAGYYGALAKPWMEAARIPRGADGRPANADDKKIYAIAFVLQLLVAGMMRHVFALSGIDTIGAGIVSGAGIGMFFISPWIALNNLYGMRSAKLSLIDGGYATLACAAMGLVLALF